MSLPKIWELMNGAVSRGQIGSTYWPASGGLTIYVRTDGNNSNTGLENTAAGAVLSWAGVFEVLRKVNVKDATVTVQFGAGTFAGEDLAETQFTGTGTGALQINGVAGETFFSSALTLRKVRVTISNIEFQQAVQVYEGATVYFSKGCVFDYYLTVRYGGHAIVTNGIFKEYSTPSHAVQAYQGGNITFIDKVTYSGTFLTGLTARNGGRIDFSQMDSIPIEFINASFSAHFIDAGGYHSGGDVEFRGTPVITGTATGVKYHVNGGGRILGISKDVLDGLAIGNLPGTWSTVGITASGHYISSGTSTASGYLLHDGTDAFAPVVALQSRVTALEAGGGSGTVAIGSQTQAGILRLASDQRLTLENDTEPARADQVASLYSRTSLVEARVTTLEASGGTGTGDITINPTGGLESAANGVGIKLTASTTTAATSGLTTTASGTSVSLPYNIGAVAASSYAGRVQPLAASYFTRNRADVSTTYLVPHANAHQALVNRVFALEDSVGDVATALAAILRS